jgi:hypothetical protein
MSPIRMRDGQILMNGGQLVNRADHDPSCCCPPPQCCNGEQIPAEVYMDIDAWSNGYCSTPPKCEDAGVLNATGFVLPFVRQDESYFCIYQHVKTFASLCGAFDWRYVLQVLLYTTGGGDYQWAAGYVGFSTDDYQDAYGVYSIPPGQNWVHFASLIDSCASFDIQKFGIGWSLDQYYPCWVNGYREDTYMRVYT